MRHVSTYPSEEQFSHWSERAEEMGMSKSQFVMCMVEAGIKKFEREVDPDETKNDLRQQRADLREELSRTRDRVEKLERQLLKSDRQTILEYLDEEPGVGFHDVVQHIQNTTASRVANLLGEMVGAEVTVDDGRYFRRDE